jgi:phosphoserine phosphatase
MQRDLNIARTIQQGLLPKSDPQVTGFDVAGWNRPADETGGDCYDFMLLDGGGLTVTIADATGHGIGPALVISETRALFRAIVSQTRDLAKVVTQVNHLLCEDLPDDKFVTAFFGLLSPADCALEFISAGHGPLLFFEAATGGISERKPHGLPLGIMKDMGYDEPERLVLAPGDMMVLFTDGFIEWTRADGEQYGTERLFALLREHRQRSSTELIKLVYQSVLDFAAGAPQADDLTAVIIKKL